MIEISNLNLFYKKVQILKNIDFAMRKILFFRCHLKIYLYKKGDI